MDAGRSGVLERMETCCVQVRELLQSAALANAAKTSLHVQAVGAMLRGEVELVSRRAGELKEALVISREGAAGTSSGDLSAGRNPGRLHMSIDISSSSSSISLGQVTHRVILTMVNVSEAQFGFCGCAFFHQNFVAFALFAMVIGRY